MNKKYKLLVISIAQINYVNEKSISVCSQVIEFDSEEEADIAFNNIMSDYVNCLTNVVTKLY